ncbi:SH3 domain-containing protein [Pseudoduganella flava]|uniref:SH3 domain-containing protein n=1 Tax=Pseudoduganella flava TaxID=871742 RepID=A0A562PGZ3_9BURK|nr:SH3 domain-containing protein [Pseudoduganella flava]QGZ42573.1 SH3 domain-containing protein [Pseudoduganella flava]TWI43725.1 SH3 domain-containing protein [Pseudoduganella flava]
MITQYGGALAYLIGLAMTLVLASFLTPAHWWRRPTARGLVIVGGGTWACGALLLYFAAAAPLPFSSALTNGSMMQGDVPAQHIAAELPRPGQRYRVHRDLNVRDGAGVAAARLSVVPAGAYVTPTGQRQGDWWQIRYDGGAGPALGWASSLWLRAAAER